MAAKRTKLRERASTKLAKFHRSSSILISITVLIVGHHE